MASRLSCVVVVLAAAAACAGPPAGDDVSLVVALRLRNTAELHRTAIEVSTPGHPRYGRHLSAEDLRGLVAPAPEDARRVVDFISGVSPRCGAAARLARSGDMISVRCPAKDAERLLGRPLVPAARGALRTEGPVAGVPEDVARLVAFWGGADTPVHGGRPLARDADADAGAGGLAADPPAPATVVWDGTGSTAGQGSVELRFHVRCADGTYANATSDGGWPCSAGDGSVERVAVRAEWRSGGRRDFLLVEADGAVECGGEGSRSCVATVGGGALPMYEPIVLTVEASFAGAGTPPSTTPPSPARVCKETVTPQWLWDLYGLPVATERLTPRTSLAVAEFLGEFYSEADLRQFMRDVGLPYEPVSQVRGTNNASDPGGEASLDQQIVSASAAGADLWFWSDTRLNAENDEEPFLRWLRDVNELGDDGPLVWSISYGDIESSLGDGYLARVSDEFAKLAARGRTVLVSSGDDGSAGYYARRNQSAHDAACAVAEPEYPATDPWVTAVGATQLLRGAATPGCPGCVAPAEAVCSAATDGVITSGGGFSNVFAAPEHSAGAVATYLDGDAGTPMPPQSFFNRSGRPYPDVSAYGNNYLVVLDGRSVALSGTSASTPLFAALVARVNEALLAAGAPPLGFLNPLIYSLPAGAFRDVVTGDTRCLVHGHECCANGFEAAVGWDPATGRGVPRYDALLAAALDAAGVGAGASSAGADGADDRAKKAYGVAVFALIMALLSMALVVYLLQRMRSSSPAFQRAGTSSVMLEDVDDR